MNNKMLTQKDRSNLPALGAQDGKGLDATVYIKFFGPGRWTWYGTEYDPEERVFFGYVLSGLDPNFDELGYFSLDEFEGVNQEKGYQVIQRDMYFEPVSLKQVMGGDITVLGQEPETHD